MRNGILLIAFVLLGLTNVEAQTYETNSTTYSEWNKKTKDYEVVKADSNITTFTMNNMKTIFFQTVNGNRQQFSIDKMEKDSKSGLVNYVMTAQDKSRYVFNLDIANKVIISYHENGKTLAMTTYTISKMPMEY